MENRDSYHNIIQKILKRYYQLATKQADLQNDSEVSDRLALDKNRGQYLWFRFGWDDKQFVQYIIMYLCIKNGKVWVEQDSTDLCVVDDLLAAGIPANDIVLGFHHPNKRKLTEFA